MIEMITEFINVCSDNNLRKATTSKVNISKIAALSILNLNLVKSAISRMRMAMKQNQQK